jgi:hypothetical protein
MGSVMPDTPKTGLEVLWLNERRSLEINSDKYEEVRIADRALVLRDWAGHEHVLVDQTELLGSGLARVLVLRDSTQPLIAVVLGEGGSELLKLDFERPGWARLAELPRDYDGGMRRVEILQRTEVTLLHWELGVLAVDSSLELRWRHDLEWNHQLIYLDDSEIWFDLKYDAAELPHRVGEEPWGFSVLDGRQLFDRRPPT